MKSIIRLFLLGILLFLPQTCAAEWEMDFQIDRELGVLTSRWRIPLTRLQTRFDAPREVRPGLPPYDQQVMGAQNYPPVVRPRQPVAPQESVVDSGRAQTPAQPVNPNQPNNPNQ